MSRLEDDSGILEEFTAEREGLEAMIAAAKDITKEEISLSASPFIQLEDLDGKLGITGIALAEGVWKNVLYPSEEIKKAALRLKDRPLIVEHGIDQHFGRKQVGKVRTAYFDEVLKSIVFQAQVTDPEAIKLVKDGTFPAVSCSTWVDKFPLNQDQQIGFNFQFNELSLVRSPACDKCFIFSVEELSKRLVGGKEDLNMESGKARIGEDIMSEEEEDFTEEEEEVTEELEEEVDLSEMEKPSLYAVIELDDLSALPEDLKKKAVSYYYGYKDKEGKYPYKGYPGYPYKPGKKGKGKPETKSLWAVVEMASPEEIMELKKAGKKIKAAYYGYYGFPMAKAPHYPYYSKYEKPEKKSEEMAKPKEEEIEDEEAKRKKDEEDEEVEKMMAEDLALPKDYAAFMGKCMKESKVMPVIKRMRACAAAYKKQKGPEEKAAAKCPSCGEEVPEEKYEEHVKACKPEEKAVEVKKCPNCEKSIPVTEYDAHIKECKPEEKSVPEAKEWTDKPPLEQPKTPPGYDVQAEHVKLSATTTEVNKAEAPKSVSVGPVTETKKEEMVKTTPAQETPPPEVKTGPCAGCPEPTNVQASASTAPTAGTPAQAPVPAPIPAPTQPVAPSPTVEVAPTPVPTANPTPAAPIQPAEAPKAEVKDEIPKLTEEDYKLLKENYPQLLVELAKRRNRF